MHMIELALKSDRLVAHAQMQGHNHIHDEDLGYAVHGWLRDAVGEAAPRPFRLMEQRNGALRLLGYSKTDAKTLHERASQLAPPLAFEVCDWNGAASKPLDGIAWRRGQRLAFELRACPVVRGKQGERDAFLAQLPANDESMADARAAVYGHWLAKQLQESDNPDKKNAAQLEEGAFNLKGFRLVSTWRQGQTSVQAGRKGRRVVRPDALLTGQLTVLNPDAFRNLLYCGIGRHRAFGFGMLLVRPA
ncbi:MAG: type I-E CRISPR-associated protein Cas6/Cse3/CasE [Salinisphaera sp.]|nr:type I-E CRISPR-associated protein Cas6/Cse3/CasE [Salinisphaera sp.]